MFYGWWILTLLFFMSVFSGATVWYGFTAYFKPLISEFGWSYTAISFAASLRGIEVGLFDIVVGFLIDRIGGRWIVILGSVVVGIGFLLLSRINDLATFYISFIILLVGATAYSTLVSMAILTRWFNKRLGLVLGIVSAGYGAAGFTLPGIVYLLESLGFRQVFLIFSILAFALGAILFILIRNRPEDMGLMPDGIVLNENLSTTERIIKSDSLSSYEVEGTNVKKAFSRLPFWIIVFLNLSFMFFYHTVTTHVMPYLEHIDYSRHLAGLAAMGLPAISILGRVMTGYISDYVQHKFLVLQGVAMAIIGTIMFSFAVKPWSLIPSIILLGTSYGVITVLRPLLLKNFFGIRYIASLMGVVMGISVLGSMCGPLIAGWFFDTTNSYQIVWLICAVLLAMNIPLVLSLKNPIAV
ncbi:MFS transporter [Chloroflexota bacterium]